MTRFGPSGNSLAMQSQIKKTEQAAQLVAAMGLDIYEYSFGRGVNITDEKAISLGQAFANEGIELSVHSPYFVNFSNTDDNMIDNSIHYIINSLKKLTLMQGKRCVFHPAAQGKATREAANSRMLYTLSHLLECCDREGFSNVYLCPETMGKMGQMGTVAEIANICKLDDRLIPCIDFGHVNAREQGILKSVKEFDQLIGYLFDELPACKVQNMHIHFSKIEYGLRGELRHLNFDDEIYGPDYRPFIEVLKARHMDAFCICESAGFQDTDALTMKNYYRLLEV